MSDNTTRTGKKDKKRKLPFILLIAIVGFLIYFFLIEDNSLSDTKNLVSKIIPSETDSQEEIPLDNNFIEGLKLASVDKYNEAITHFGKVKFEDLSEKDRFIILSAYLKAGQPNKAIKLDSTFDKVVIEEYVKVDSLEKLREVKAKSELIAFEVAVLDNDYEKIIELKDADRLVIDKRKAMAIADAYYQLDLLEKAVDFTSLTAYDGINIWKDYEASENIQVNETNRTANGTPENSSSSIDPLITLLILGGVIGLLVFIFYKIRNKIQFTYFLEKIKKQKQEKGENEKVIDINVHELEEKDLEDDAEKNTEKESHTIENKNEAEDDKYSYYYKD